MNPLQSAVLHTVNAVILVAAAVALLMTGHIDASTGVALIAAAGGISLGVGAVSIGASQGVPTTPASNAVKGVGTVPTP